MTIGDEAAIGTYSVVRDNIPLYAITFGDPARVIKYRFSNETLSELLNLKLVGR